MNEFLQMGGYGVYVWSAYGVAGLVLLGLTVWTLAGLKRSGAELAALEALAPRRRRRPAVESPDRDSGEAPDAQS